MSSSVSRLSSPATNTYKKLSNSTPDFDSYFGKQTVEGTNKKNVIAVTGGSNIVYGQGGNDILFSYNSYTVPGAKDGVGKPLGNAYHRAPGNGFKFERGARDILHGGDGNDDLHGTAHVNMYGGKGNDRYSFAIPPHDGGGNGNVPYDFTLPGQNPITSVTISDSEGRYDTLKISVTNRDYDKISLRKNQNSGKVDVIYDGKKLPIDGIEHVVVSSSPTRSDANKEARTKQLNTLINEMRSFPGKGWDMNTNIRIMNNEK